MASTADSCSLRFFWMVPHGSLTFFLPRSISWKIKATWSTYWSGLKRPGVDRSVGSSKTVFRTRRTSLSSSPARPSPLQGIRHAVALWSRVEVSMADGMWRPLTHSPSLSASSCPCNPASPPRGASVGLGSLCGGVGSPPTRSPQKVALCVGIHGEALVVSPPSLDGVPLGQVGSSGCWNSLVKGYMAPSLHRGPPGRASCCPTGSHPGS